MKNDFGTFRRVSWARIAFALALVLALTACQTDLYKNLSERQANEMAATLSHHGIAAERHYQDDGTIRLTVDKSRFADAVDVLRDAGLPDQQFETMGEVFKSSGLVSSPAQEHARMIYALGQELSHTISNIDGVLNARVQVVLPDNDLLQQNRKPSSASVFIRYNRDFDVDKLTPRIKKLVSDGVSGLSYDNVSMVAVRAAVPKRYSQGRADAMANTSFLGLSIAPTSVGAARWLFGGLFVLILSLIGVIAWLVRKDRKQQSPYALDTRASADS